MSSLPAKIPTEFKVLPWVMIAHEDNLCIQLVEFDAGYDVPALISRIQLEEPDVLCTPRLIGYGASTAHK